MSSGKVIFEYLLIKPTINDVDFSNGSPHVSCNVWMDGDDWNLLPLLIIHVAIFINNQQYLWLFVYEHQMNLNQNLIAIKYLLFSFKFCAEWDPARSYFSLIDQKVTNIVHYLWKSPNMRTEVLNIINNDKGRHFPLW